MRLGCLKRGTLDIVDHPWYKNCPWNSVYRQEIRAPYSPSAKSQLCWTIEKTSIKEEPIYINANKNEYQENFLNF